MDKKYLSIAIACLLVGLGVGLLAPMIFGDKQFNYQPRLNFDGSGFEQSKSRELAGQIKEVNKSSLLVSFALERENAKDLRAVPARLDKEVIVNEQSEILVSSLKTDEDRYGAAAVAKIGQLEASKQEMSKSSRTKSVKIAQEIALIKKSAREAVEARVAELSKQMAALAAEDQGARARLAGQIEALNSDYKFTPIKLSDLKVGENVTLQSANIIDLKKTLVAERLVVKR